VLEGGTIVTKGVTIIIIYLVVRNANVVPRRYAVIKNILFFITGIAGYFNGKLISSGYAIVVAISTRFLQLFLLYIVRRYNR
jgi:hypothetical protein